MPRPQPRSDGLESLLEVERSLEARVEAAERRAAQDVAAARDETRRRAEEQAREVEAEAAREESRDLADHAAALRGIEEQAQAAVRRLDDAPPGLVERLARGVYVRVVRGGDP